MLAGLLLFVSGAAALVYQTLWVKQLALIVGVDVYAITTAVAAFFAGLALGGALLGRLADRTPQPLALYAALEVGIAGLGVGATFTLARSAEAFLALQGALGPLAWALPFVLVGLPAFLMGGTLPALVRSLAPDDESVGRASGLLYAANTAGAIAGTLATAFLLVSWLGVQGAGLMAGTVNLALAVVAVGVGRRRRVRPADREAEEPLTREARLAVALYALAGGVALGYEVVWTQAIIQFLSTRTYAFATVLATYLTGLVLGSFLYALFADRVRQRWIVFGLLVACAGACALITFAGLGAWLPRLQASLGSAVLDITGSRLAMISARFALASLVVVLPTTILLGAAFPAAVRLVADPQRVGRDVGAVAAFNTAGGIAGTYLTGFVAIPTLGLVRTLGVLSLFGAFIGGAAVLRGGGRRIHSLALASTLVLVVGFIALRVPQDKLAQLLSQAREGTLVYYEESPGGTVAVLEQSASAGTFRRLYIQGVSNSGDALTSLRYMRLQALLPLLIHRGEPNSALVIGLGTGITTGALLAYPLDRRVCVELLPAVVRAAPLFDGNYGVADDSRVDIRVRDGRHELLASEQRYDLITLEPPPPSAANVVNLYSREFYELARDRLMPNGLLAQWWPLTTQNDDDSRSLVRSLLDVFPHVTLWTTELHETMVIGSMEPIELDVVRITSRFEQPEVAAALRQVGIASPAALLATYVTDRAGLERYAGDARPVTDDRPRIEYAGWVRPREITRVLPQVRAVASGPPVLGGDARLSESIAAERRTLWGFYQAGLHAYAGERAEWAALIRQVLQEDGDNPYYRWFLGRVQ
ncbi:MAG: fused MFS/spermidine synthase [Gemmatimonadota bacterium]|nr:MAG: fused MFS/spermidine synthase [Gemmatimonadota bacterium]